MRVTRTRILLTAAILLAVALLSWRSLTAVFADNMGNLALLKDRQQSAIGWFSYGLGLEPGWSLLHEDLGRALLSSRPKQALSQFQAARCGAPCEAEIGDALLRLNQPVQAEAHYVTALAVTRVNDRATQLAYQRQVAHAIALEKALITRLQPRVFDRAALASAYAALGNVESIAATTAVDKAVHRRAAIADFSLASNIAPMNEGYLLSYGTAELQWGSREHARDAFERVLHMHPGEHDAETMLKALDSSARRVPNS